jgi:uncharacterized membrane protein
MFRPDKDLKKGDFGDQRVGSHTDAKTAEKIGFASFVYAVAIFSLPFVFFLGFPFMMGLANLGSSRVGWVLEFIYYAVAINGVYGMPIYLLIGIFSILLKKPKSALIFSCLALTPVCSLLVFYFILFAFY